METLKDRLSNWEVDPPQAVWDRLSQELPDHGLGRLAARLDAFEATPPAAAWDRIASGLTPAATPAKVLPFTTRYRKHIRYASAAVIAGLVLFGTMLLLPKRTDSDNSLVTGGPSPADTGRAPAKPSSLPGLTAKNIASQTVSSNPQAYSAASGAAKSTENRLALASMQPSVLHSISNQIQHAASDLLAHVQLGKPAVSFYQGVDKYMVYSDGEGNAFKLPKKLYDAVACPEVDASCHARLKNLQARISEASLSSDFTGVLEILESLDQ